MCIRDRMSATPGASTEPVSEMELQSFWSVLQKIGKVAGKVPQVVKTGADIAGQLGLLAATPGASTEPVSELELQSFWSVLQKIGNCLLYTSPSPRDRQKSRMPSS